MQYHVVSDPNSKILEKTVKVHRRVVTKMDTENWILGGRPLAGHKRLFKAAELGRKSQDQYPKTG